MGSYSFCFFVQETRVMVRNVIHLTEQLYSYLLRFEGERAIETCKKERQMF